MRGELAQFPRALAAFAVTQRERTVISLALAYTHWRRGEIAAARAACAGVSPVDARDVQRLAVLRAKLGDGEYASEGPKVGVAGALASAALLIPFC